MSSFMQELLSFCLTAPADGVTMREGACVYSWMRGLCLFISCGVIQKENSPKTEMFGLVLRKSHPQTLS